MVETYNLVMFRHVRGKARATAWMHSTNMTPKETRLDAGFWITPRIECPNPTKTTSPNIRTHLIRITELDGEEVAV